MFLINFRNLVFQDVMLCGLVYWYQCSRAIQMCPGDRGSRFPHTYQILGALSHKTKSHNILLIKEVDSGMSTVALFPIHCPSLQDCKAEPEAIGAEKALYFEFSLKQHLQHASPYCHVCQCSLFPTSFSLFCENGCLPK